MKFLEEVRRARRWSQTVLAFHAQMTQSEVSKFERGLLRPRPLQAERLSRVLGVPPEPLTWTVAHAPKETDSE
jgi:transcriptional regulator with XRE-family HTH domain